MGKRYRIKRSPGHLKLSIKELKEVVHATEEANKIESSSDEDQIAFSSFGTLQDSGELAKGRKAQEASNGAKKGNESVMAKSPQSSMEVGGSSSPSTPHGHQGLQKTSSKLHEQWDLGRQKEETQKMLAIIAAQLQKANEGSRSLDDFISNPEAKNQVEGSSQTVRCKQLVDLKVERDDSLLASNSKAISNLEINQLGVSMVGEGGETHAQHINIVADTTPPFAYRLSSLFKHVVPHLRWLQPLGQ